MGRGQRYAELGATTYRHQSIDSILANTNYDTVVAFGYNEISDVWGDIQDPIPESAVRQSWADTVRVAKTQCLGWMTMEYAGWQKIGASENSLMMRMIRWMNNFIRTTGGKVLPVEIRVNNQHERRRQLAKRQPFGSTPTGFGPQGRVVGRRNTPWGSRLREMLDQCSGSRFCDPSVTRWSFVTIWLRP